MRRRLALHALAALALVALTLALYRVDLGLGFFDLDDASYVTANPWIAGASWAHLRFVLTEPYFGSYAPAQLLAYMADFAWAGLDPRFFHLSSNLWAGLCAAGVYAVGVALFGRSLPAFAAALLFAAHPAHVEAVAWISSRKDLVAAGFGLPVIAAYLSSRRGGPRPRAWYALSVALFLPALAGKLSVATVPAILLGFDLLVERRRGAALWLDKLPYAALVAFFALRAAAAAPSPRVEPQAFVAGHSLLQSLWLLGGFGDYVVARDAPARGAAVALQVAWSAGALLCAALPFGFARRLPGLALALWAWIVLALAPPLAASLVHPVADRYLFLPSAGLALLLAFAGMRAAERWPRHAPLALAAGALLLGLWTRGTRAYLAEWGDPRSLWFSAARKSSDPEVRAYLGGHYLDCADALDRADRREASRALAELEWVGDPRLSSLLDELARGDVGSSTRAFQLHLREQAGVRLAQALLAKGDRVMPNLYLQLGKLSLDRGELDHALEWFGTASNEAERHSLASYRAEQRALAAYDIGGVYRAKGDWVQAVSWIAYAEKLQRDAGGSWLPGVAEERHELERRCHCAAPSY